jgi:hypothetical protein
MVYDVCFSLVRRRKIKRTELAEVELYRNEGSRYGSTVVRALFYLASCCRFCFFPYLYHLEKQENFFLYGIRDILAVIMRNTCSQICPEFDPLLRTFSLKKSCYKKIRSSCPVGRTNCIASLRNVSVDKWSRLT